LFYIRLYSLCWHHNSKKAKLYCGIDRIDKVTTNEQF